MGIAALTARNQDQVPDPEESFRCLKHGRRKMKRRVVLAGWGQVTQAKQIAADRVRDPLGLMAAASRRAFEMTGSFAVPRSLDGVMVVKVMSTYYASADRSLADKMGLSPRMASHDPDG